VAGLLRNYQLPSEALYGYFRAYSQAAREHLEEPGQPIVDWFGELVDVHAPNQTGTGDS
jgi:hypothetical protein